MVVVPPRRVTTISSVGKRSGWCLEGGRGPNHFSNWLHCPFGVSRSVGLERAVNSAAQPFPNSSTISERRRSDWLWTSVGARFGFIWGRTLGRRKRIRWARHDKHNGVTALGYDVSELCTNLLLHCADDGWVIPSLPPSSNLPPPPPATPHQKTRIYLLHCVYFSQQLT